MPDDITTLDLFAFVWFIGIWVVFTVVQDHLLHKPVAINQQMTLIRQRWMERMLQRDNRIMDAQLIGHTMNSCTFFASTTMLVLAGLVGAFGGIDRLHEIVNDLFFTIKTSRELLEMKMLMLVGIFVFAFFKFTWALRQYNYCCALIGSSPLAPMQSDLLCAISENIAMAMTLALKAFNGGLRSYYFALAALAWVAGPWFLVVATGWVVLVLIRRQGFSRMERVIAAQVEVLKKIG